MRHIFGFVDDYSKVTSRMRDTLQLVRKDNNDALLRAAAVGAGKEVLSRLVLSRLVLSRLVLSRLVLSRLVLSRLVLSRLVLSGLVLSRLVLSRLVLSRLVLSRLVLSRLVLYVPIVQPNDVRKVNLYKSIAIVIPVSSRMRQRETFSLPQARLVVSSAPEKPRWVLVGLQTDKSGNQENNTAILRIYKCG